LLGKAARSGLSSAGMKASAAARLSKLLLFIGTVEADVDSALDGSGMRCAAVERPSTMIAALGFSPAG